MKRGTDPHTIASMLRLTANRVSQLATANAASLARISRFYSQGKRTPIAIAFDIDGVLKQGEKVLPEALRTIRMLEGDNPWKQKVPYIFITNGGGKDEATRSKNLSKDLDTNVSRDQVVQAHTVMQSLVEQYRDEAILMIGGPELPPGSSRKVLEGCVHGLMLDMGSVACTPCTIFKPTTLRLFPMETLFQNSRLQ